MDAVEDLVKDLDFDVVAGAESRGFIFGTPIAYNMHKPFDEWEDKPETLAIQNENGTVSVYDVEYYDTNEVNEYNNVRFRGNPEKVGLKMFTKADTYTGVRAEELIKADLVYCDI